MNISKDCNHPITPPPELFAEWLAEAKRLHPAESTGFIAGEVARLAYRTGADQELEACCELLNDFNTYHLRELLRAARRPKPPSLKEKALEDLDILIADLANHGMGFKATNIRRALEQLSDEQ
jgi:hypothetical protein